MKPIRSLAIVLRRTNYGEADRVLSLLTPESGKLSVIAKGVRKEKSKLAGAIELFSVVDVVVTPGKGQMGTLTGAKMHTFFAHIMTDYDRLQFGYEGIKQVSKGAEQVNDPAFFELLRTAFESLDNLDVPLVLTKAWFWLQLAILNGAGLNLATDVNGMKLVEGQNYHFDSEEMAFMYSENGEYTTDHIKILRVLSASSPTVVSHVGGVTPQLLQQVLYLAERAVSH